MNYTIVYFIILSIILFFCISKRKNPMGILLIVLYLLIGFFSVILVKNNFLNAVDIEKIKFWPYFYLIICYIILFLPFLHKKGLKLDKAKSITNSRTYVLFMYVYILFALIALASSFPTVIKLINEGNWSFTYGENSIYTYSNIVEYVSINIVGYTRMLALVAGFSFLVDLKRTKKFFWISITVIVCAILTGISESVLSTSRSMIYDIILVLAALSLFYFNGFSKRKKVLFILVVVLSSIPIIKLLFDISFSRFELRGINEYLIYYLGQAPIVFNSQLSTQIVNIKFGTYFLGGILGQSGFDPTSIGGTWSSRFYTFVGFFYIDWGFIGTIIICILSSLLFWHSIKKKKYYISDLFLIFTYYQFLTKGVFVIGRTYIYTIISTIVIYFFAKYVLEKVKITNDISLSRPTIERNKERII